MQHLYHLARNFVITILLFQSFCISAYAASDSVEDVDLPTIAELHAKYIEANGGRSNLAAVRSVTLNADYLKAGEETAKIVIYRKRPNMLRNRIILPNLEINEIYNNGEGWRVFKRADGETLIKDIEADELNQLRRNAGIEGAFFNLEGRDEYGKVVAIEEIMGAPAYRIEVSAVANQEFDIIWLSLEHFQEVKLSKVTDNETTGNKSLNEVYLSDFSTISGVHFASKADSYIDGELISELIITSARVNVGIYNSFFEKPKDL